MLLRGNGKSEESVELGAFSPLRGSLPELISASLFLNILGLALPLALLQIYDRILPNQSFGTLSLLVLGVASALILETVLRIGRSHVTGWIGARFEHRAGCAAFQHLLASRLDAYEGQGSGVHLERFGALNTVKEFYSGQAVLTLLDLPFVAVYLALIAFLAGWLMLVPLVLLSCFVLGAYLLGNTLRDSVKNRMTADDRRFNFIIEVLGGIHSVKAMAMESAMLRRYERLQESCAKGDYDVGLNSASALGLATFFAQFTTVIVVALGSLMVMSSDLTTGGLAACTLLSGRALQPVQRAMSIWTRFQTIRVARERLREIFDLEPESEPGLPPIPPLAGSIELQNAAFHYAPNKALLSGINLEVAQGECIGISGGNGSGKTSLLLLMLGALRPSEGRVMLDGLDPRGFEPESIRHQVAYLPQQGAVFQGTILENITMFRPDLADEAILSARRLGLDAAVATMPLGYDTPIGDGAHDSLPRGIKQRIAIARALVHNPRVVLFDEANSAVDVAGDEHIKACLEDLKGRCTLVLVTHRPSLLKMADRVFDLSQGGLLLREPSGARA